MHMMRGLMYGSYQKPRELLWIFGMLIFLVLMAEAFMGYLLPWGNMSYWGAQVIISLFGAIPINRNSWKDVPRCKSATRTAILFSPCLILQLFSILHCFWAKSCFGFLKRALAKKEEMDSKKYMEFMESTLDQITSSMDLDFDTILGKPKQTGLDQFFWN